MNCSEFEERIDDCLADTLTPAQRAAVEAHLRDCASCRAALDSARALRADAALLPREISPARDLWPAIAIDVRAHEDAERSRRGNEAVPIPSSQRLPSALVLRRALPLAAAAAIVGAVTIYWPRSSTTKEKTPEWSVASVSGAPRIGTATLNGRGTWRVGQWLETDADSSARFDVGTIGEVQLGPNSRLRLLESAPTDHRIELARGTMHALIWAPPRLFFVETPSATAIDLGCAYTLTVDDHGASTLHVTSGYVALEHGDHESLIPAGMMCVTRRDTGPGTPFSEDAPQALRDALQRFDFESGGDDAIAEILTQSSRHYRITLWHLFARANAAQRGSVFDRMAALTNPPEGVTRAGIIAGDRTMLDLWASELGLASLAHSAPEK